MTVNEFWSQVEADVRFNDPNHSRVTLSELAKIRTERWNTMQRVDGGTFYAKMRDAKEGAKTAEMPAELRTWLTGSRIPMVGGRKAAA